MHTALARLLGRLNHTDVTEAGVIPWGAPVLSFGDPDVSYVASLGLNPSNREFVDEAGSELHGGSRRFPTLQSLGLDSWSHADASHIRAILDACRGYFEHNPYDRWFRRLDGVIAGTGVSYYTPLYSACHLDLIPFATTQKWGNLTPVQRSALRAAAGDTLGILLRDSAVRVVVLNGRSVVAQFELFSGVTLTREQMSSWTLPRQSGPGVIGVAYHGAIDLLDGVSLDREILVLGYNHNLQSSYGVTSAVITAISQWVTRSAGRALGRG